MKTSIYPGSFDPITFGHIDIIERAAKISDKLIVSVLTNNEKQSLFSISERVEMIKESVDHIPNVEVESFDGLLVDFAKKKGADTIIRGLREMTDFEYELKMAQTNRALYDKIETVFLITSPEYAYLSSSSVREVASFDGDVSKFVPRHVAVKLKFKYQN